MPVFWVGFNLLMFAAGRLVKRIGPGDAMALGAACGAIATLAAALAPNLPVLLAAQFLAGGCWGAALVAAYTAAVSLGRTGREGRFLGTLFAVLAAAVGCASRPWRPARSASPGSARCCRGCPRRRGSAAALLLLAAGRASRPA